MSSIQIVHTQAGVFTWDAAKDAGNVAKHGIGFAQAIAMFDAPVLTRADDRHDYGERRDLSLGQLQRVAVIAVVHTDRDGGRRIISARRANRRERASYEAALRSRHEP